MGNVNVGNCQIIQGNAIDVLKTLDSESVQCCVTSPPYFGLRDYGTASWNGGDPNCDHKRDDQKRGSKPEYKQSTNNGGENARNPFRVSCGKCGAVRVDDQIGLEQTPQEYVAKMVSVFAEVHRVLKADGTLWLNLGDSYWTDAHVRISAKEAFSETWDTSQTASRGGLRKTAASLNGLKNKSLIGIPWRVAFALQEAGWMLRQDIIWAKPNPMPESVRDRCTKAHEYLFLLIKSPRYYFNQDAIREPLKDASVVPGKTNGNMKAVSKRDDSLPRNRNGKGKSTLDIKPVRIGLCGATANKKSVWHVATQPYKEAHFATFPEKLIEPCILAGSKEGDIVLDPFSGSGTTGLVSLKHNRNYIGIELNPEYIEISHRRLATIQPKLVECL